MKWKGKTVQIKESSHAASLQTSIVQHLTVNSPSRLKLAVRDGIFSIEEDLS